MSSSLDSSNSPSSTVDGRGRLAGEREAERCKTPGCACGVLLKAAVSGKRMHKTTHGATTHGRCDDAEDVWLPHAVLIVQSTAVIL
mmetsp:Transcript_2072/g.4673  ORF Transcript_2072/g.4673 Transcript_2072/m.4673 type:complete len:86 (-) Transcript_2072:40-297(-)